MFSRRAHLSKCDGRPIAASVKSWRRLFGAFLKANGPHDLRRDLGTCVCGHPSSRPPLPPLITSTLGSGCISAGTRERAVILGRRQLPERSTCTSRRRGQRGPMGPPEAPRVPPRVPTVGRPGCLPSRIIANLQDWCLEWINCSHSCSTITDNFVIQLPGPGVRAEQ